MRQKARSIRLTSSNFVAICRRKKIVTHEFLKSVHIGNDISHIKSVKYGGKNEKKAKELHSSSVMSRNKDVILYPSGFVINPAFPFLGTSPDGIVKDKTEKIEVGLLEVKCPSSKEGKNLIEACSDAKFYLELINGLPHLKLNSEHYYQVQGQMLITNTVWCDFCVCNGTEVWVERIRRNDNFCKEMLSKLCDFYTDHFQPFLKNLHRKPPVIVFFK